MTSEKLKDLYSRAGFSVGHIEDKWPHYIPISAELKKLIELVVDDCAEAAKLAARSFSDGDGASGCSASANAVKVYGSQLLKEE